MAGLLLLGLVVRMVHPGGLPPEGGGDSLLVVIAREAEAWAADTTPSPGLAEEGRVRINLASEADLARLPGIGPALARRIREARESGGPFASVDDLCRVKGIGPKIATRLRPLVSFATDSIGPVPSDVRATPGGGERGADRNGGLHPATHGSGPESLDGSEP